MYITIHVEISRLKATMVFIEIILRDPVVSTHIQGMGE